MKYSGYLLVFITLSTLLGACANSPKQPQATMKTDSLNIAHRENLANRLFKQKNYHESLIQWKILRTIQPHNLQYNNRIRVLQALIKRRLNIHLNTAKLALQKNDIKTAKHEYLKALALDPKQDIAINALKKITLSQLEKIQTRKNNTTKNDLASFYLELGIVLFNKKDWHGSIREIKKYLNINPTDKPAIKLVSRASLNLSEQYEERGYLEPAVQLIEALIALDKPNAEKYTERLLHLKQRLSANYYIEGVKTYRDNLEQAIGYWERALKANPENEKAKIRLHKAQTRQKKLKESARP